MTVAEIQEYIDRLIKNEYQDDSEQRTPRNTRTHFEDIKSMLDELEPKLETVTNEKEFPQYFWNNIKWVISQVHNEKDLKEKTILATTKADDEEIELEITVRSKS